MVAHPSVDLSISWLRAMTAQRTLFLQSVLAPTDPLIDRHSGGAWSGTWTMPTTGPTSISPVIVMGPLFFPLAPGRVDFSGRVDVPFYSMDGWAGRRDMTNPTPPPATITDPSTVYANGGANWGRYFVVGTLSGTTQFIAPVAANAAWSWTITSPAFPGPWSFQLITYANATDVSGDTNRIMVGNPWNEVDHPGDVRSYFGATYATRPAQFSGVAVNRTTGAATITGTLAAFTPTAGRTYQILVTNETDVEYAWALQSVAGAGAFTITRSVPLDGGAKLRLVEQLTGCSVRVVGQVWAEENAADANAYPDLRIEYVGITASVPTFPASIQPAQRDGSWHVTLAGGGAVGRVALVDINTKRVYGQYTMPSGLLRSFIVPADEAGQDTTSVYYDGFSDSCFLYDQAVSLAAYLQQGLQAEAVKLVDALLDVQSSDGSFPFSQGQATLYDRSGAGFVRNGAVGWVCYALLLAAQPQFQSWFTTRPDDAAKRCLAFLLGYRTPIGTISGGKGQFANGVLDPAYVVPWWSTEHNIDVWWCLDLADQLYGSDTVNYRAAADGIRRALLAEGWDNRDGIFRQGGTVTGGGVNVPDTAHALDTHTWGGILLFHWGRAIDAVHSLDRAKQYYYVTDAATRLSGYTTCIALDGYPADTIETPWYEGSFGAVCALRGQDYNSAEQLFEELALAQRPDGSYLYALQNDPVNGIHDWPCVIASAWNVLAGAAQGRLLWPINQPPIGSWVKEFSSAAIWTRE